jgi:hypothetical protein
VDSVGELGHELVPHVVFATGNKLVKQVHDLQDDLVIFLLCCKTPKRTSVT